jgi:hypothetical protein
MRRRPEISKRAGTPFRHTIWHERHIEQCDLVGAQEARSRMGVGCEIDVVTTLARRRGSSLAASEQEWLVDLNDLAKEIPDPLAALEAECGLEILESGYSL